MIIVLYYGLLHLHTLYDNSSLAIICFCLCTYHIIFFNEVDGYYTLQYIFFACLLIINLFGFYLNVHKNMIYAFLFILEVQLQGPKKLLGPNLYIWPIIFKNRV